MRRVLRCYHSLVILCCCFFCRRPPLLSPRNQSYSEYTRLSHSSSDYKIPENTSRDLFSNSPTHPTLRCVCSHLRVTRRAKVGVTDEANLMRKGLHRMSNSSPCSCIRVLKWIEHACEARGRTRHTGEPLAQRSGLFDRQLQPTRRTERHSYKLDRNTVTSFAVSRTLTPFSSYLLVATTQYLPRTVDA